MECLSRKINYYETDMMGITHHANYVHLMEEARISFLDKLGYSYHRLEQEGVGSPVRSIACKYLAPTTFDDLVTVDVTVKSFNGVMLTIGYSMRKADGTTVFTGTSEHCFLNRQGHFVRLKRDYPEFFALLMDQVEQASDGEKRAE